jgi:hypothetical protein
MNRAIAQIVSAIGLAVRAIVWIARAPACLGAAGNGRYGTRAMGRFQHKIIPATGSQKALFFPAKTDLCVAEYSAEDKEMIPEFCDHGAFLHRRANR